MIQKKDKSVKNQRTLLIILILFGILCIAGGLFAILFSVILKNPTEKRSNNINGQKFIAFKIYDSGIAVDVMFKEFHPLQPSTENNPLTQALAIVFRIELENNPKQHEFKLALDDFSCWRYSTSSYHPFFCTISSAYKINWVKGSQSADRNINKVFVSARNELNIFHSKMVNITQNYNLKVKSFSMEIVCKDGSITWIYPWAAHSHLKHMRIDLFYKIGTDIKSNPTEIDVRILLQSEKFTIIDRPKGISNGNSICQFIAFWQCMMANPSLQSFLPLWHSNPAKIRENYSSVFLSSILKRTSTSTDDYSLLLLSIASAHLNSDHSQFLDTSGTRKYMMVLFDICVRDRQIKAFEDPSPVMGEFLEKFGIIAHLFSLQFKNVEDSFAKENIYLYIRDAQQSNSSEKQNVLMPSDATVFPDLNDMGWVDAYVASPLPKSLYFHRMVTGTGSNHPLQYSKKYEYQKTYEIKSTDSVLVSDVQKNEYNYSAKIFWTLGHYTSTILHKGMWYELDDAHVESYYDISFLTPFRWTIGQGRQGNKRIENSYKSGYTGLLFQDNVALFYYQ